MKKLYEIKTISDKYVIETLERIVVLILTAIQFIFNIRVSSILSAISLDAKSSA